MRIHFSVYCIFIALLGLVLALPWIDGILLQKKYVNLLNSLSANTSIKIKIVDYQHSWLSSKVSLKLEYKNSTKSSSVFIDQIISHGPLIHNPNTGQWTFAYGFIQSTGQTATHFSLQANTMINFNEDFITQLTTPDSVVLLPTQGKVSWKGVQGMIFVNGKNSGYLQTSLQMDELDDEVNSLSTYSAKGISYQGEFTKGATKAWSATTALAVASISISSNNEKTVIQNLKTQNNFDLVSLDKIKKLDNTVDIDSISNEGGADGSLMMVKVNIKNELTQKSNALWSLTSRITSPQATLVAAGAEKADLSNMDATISAVDSDFKRQGNYKIKLLLANLSITDNTGISVNVKDLSSQIDAGLAADRSLNIDYSYLIPELAFNFPAIQANGIVENTTGSAHVNFDRDSENLKFSYENKNDLFSMNFTGFEDNQLIASFACKNSVGKGEGLHQGKAETFTNTFSLGEISFNTLSALKGIISNVKMVSSYDSNDQKIYNKKIALSFDNLTLLNYSFGSGELDLAFNALKESNQLHLISLRENMANLRNEGSQAFQVTPQTTIKGMLSLKSADGDFLSNLNIYWKTDAPLALTDPKFMTAFNMHFNLQLPIAMLNNFISSLRASSVVQQGKTPEMHFENAINDLGNNYQISNDVAGQVLGYGKEGFPPMMFNAKLNQLVLHQDLAPQQATMIEAEYARVFRGHLADILPMMFMLEVQSGSFKPVGKNYVFDFSYEQGAVKINGVDPSAPVKKSVVVGAPLNNKSH